MENARRHRDQGLAREPVWKKPVRKDQLVPRQLLYVRSNERFGRRGLVRVRNADSHPRVVELTGQTPGSTPLTISVSHALLTLRRQEARRLFSHIVTICAFEASACAIKIGVYMEVWQVLHKGAR
jgi:hypothetical protein